MLPTNVLLSGLTSMKLEERIQKMYTFTFLRLSLLCYSQFNILKLWQQCQKLKKLPPPPPPPPPRILEILEIKFSQTFQDIPKVLKKFKFLHLKVDKIVGGPVPTLFGIKCGLQTPWYKKG